MQKDPLLLLEALTLIKQKIEEIATTLEAQGAENFFNYNQCSSDLLQILIENSGNKQDLVPIFKEKIADHLSIRKILESKIDNGSGSSMPESIKRERDLISINFLNQFLLLIFAVSHIN